MHGCTSRRPDLVLMFSLLLLLIWTFGTKSSAPVWVSVSISIYGQVKVLWWYARYSSVWLWNKAIRHPHLLPRKKSGDLSLNLGTTLRWSLLQTLKWLPSLRYWLPCCHFHPFSFHTSHSTKLFQILLFSYLSTKLPLHSTPRSPCTNFCLAILSTSNIQEDISMIFFGFTFFFTSSTITNYRLNVLYLCLESTYELVHTIFVFLGLDYLNH